MNANVTGHAASPCLCGGAGCYFCGGLPVAPQPPIPMQSVGGDTQPRIPEQPVANNGNGHHCPGAGCPVCGGAGQDPG
jgi:hypothetical protein